MDEDRTAYNEHCRELLERERLNAASFDKAILTLSSAGLGVSITFISNLISLEIAECIILLKLSWFLFGLAIVSTVLSFMVSQVAMRRSFDHAEKYYIEKREEYLNRTSASGIATNILNRISGAVFIVAIIAIVTFVISNT